jgi:hypothetical protein
MSSILVVNLALGSAFGLGGYTGVPLSSISGMAVFVVAGIGVDDIFIVVHAMDRQSKALPLNERLALALFEAGPAIFLTSITNLLAFIVSSFVDFPAVEYFVVICGFAIFSTFGLTITLFAAFLFLDEQRQARGGRDVFCCMDDDPDSAVEPAAEGGADSASAAADADAAAGPTDQVIEIILMPAVSGVCIVLMIALAIAGYSTGEEQKKKKRKQARNQYCWVGTCKFRLKKKRDDLPRQAGDRHTQAKLNQRAFSLFRSGGPHHRPRSRCRERPFFAPLYTSNDQFTKTGSGQT